MNQCIRIPDYQWEVDQDISSQVKALGLSGLKLKAYQVISGISGKGIRISGSNESVYQGIRLSVGSGFRISAVRQKLSVCTITPNFVHLNFSISGLSGTLIFCPLIC